MNHAQASRSAPSGPVTVGEAVNAAVADMERQNWAAAAEGLLRVRAHLAERTPKPIFAHAATCLHRLGKYVEAEKLAREGLGVERELIAQKSSPPPERELTRRWTRDAEPVVSILCITYNHERYLESALRGFLTQRTNFPFEILIHDDASTDQTAAIVRKWQEKYPSIIRSVLQTENQLSRGICPFAPLLRLARGRYAATCEGDDYWIAPEKLQKQVDFLEQHPDFSCSAHNYQLYNETQLSVRPWLQSRTDRVLSGRQLMNLTRLLWLPTLVFRRTFSALPPERGLAPIGDQFMTSYLGTLGQCAYFETFLGAVRRENQYSIWTPLAAAEKDAIRVKTWLALIRLHERLGHPDVVADLRAKIAQSPLEESWKARLVEEFPAPATFTAQLACHE